MVSARHTSRPLLALCIRGALSRLWNPLLIPHERRASQAGADSPEAMPAAVIIGVSVTTAIFVWILWQGWKETEHAETDLRHRRRIILRLGLVYVVTSVIGVAGVVSGREPKESLIGLPIALLLAWFLLRAVLKVKVPPRS